MKGGVGEGETVLIKCILFLIKLNIEFILFIQILNKRVA